MREGGSRFPETSVRDVHSEKIPAPRATSQARAVACIVTAVTALIAAVVWMERSGHAGAARGGPAVSSSASLAVGHFHASATPTYRASVQAPHLKSDFARINYRLFAG